ncbi:MAG: HEAT repeat domain-containing protein [Armatimonadetes bacterium]|nr:HEAT repeat domain-containing protein [Armatimonadota bacterium]
MVGEDIDKLIETLRVSSVPEPDEKLSPCPGEDSILAYMSAVDGGRTGDQLTLEELRTASHIFRCRRCYSYLLRAESEADAEALSPEIDPFRLHRTDAGRMVTILGDMTRPGWVRSLAADRLAELADRTALQALRKAAQVDPDDEVREAASDAISKLENALAEQAIHGRRNARDFLRSLLAVASLGDQVPPRALAAQSTVRPEWETEGTSCDGFHWRIHEEGEGEVWLEVDTSDASLDGSTVQVLVLGEDQEPIVEERLTLLRCPDGHFRATRLLGLSLPLTAESVMSISTIGSQSEGQ